MANPEHVEVVRQGAEAVRQWRNAYPNMQVDLSEADFRKADMTGMNLRRANLRRSNLEGAELGWAILSGADLEQANLKQAKLNRADLGGASLRGADLSGTDFSQANISLARLSEANLVRVDLRGACLCDAFLNQASLLEVDLSGADLTGADLTDCRMLDVNLTGAVLVGCRVNGVSVGRATLTDTAQRDLIITTYDEPTIMVDDLEVAQFLGVLIHNTKIRERLDIVTRKVVLLLGWFIEESKPSLDAMRDWLREHCYIPVILGLQKRMFGSDFEFYTPDNAKFAAAVLPLARLARFAIIDFTAPKTALQEVERFLATVAVPVKPILLQGADEPASLLDARRGNPCILDTYCYKDFDDLQGSLHSQIIQPAEEEAKRRAR